VLFRSASNEQRRDHQSRDLTGRPLVVVTGVAPVARIAEPPSAGDGRSGTGETEHTRMAEDTRLERRLAAAVARATTPRGAAIVIATASTAITFGAGSLMTVFDHKNYPSVGSGLWWAVQTVTTVGYGDSVPTTLAGQLVAVLVMLLGIGFLTVITAAITSTFVSRSRREQAPSDAEAALAEQFRQLDSRLERIEAVLRGSPFS